MVETTDVCRVEQVRVATPVGADALPDFFKLIRIDTHLGVSPSAQASPTEQDGGVDTDLPAQLRAINLPPDAKSGIGSG